MDLKLLKEPFKESDIEWRIQRSGIKDGTPWAMVLAYVTNRAIMDRLDEVCGPENWRNEYKDAPGGGILCGISINLPVKDEQVDDDGTKTMWQVDRWITKWDGAEQTNIEKVKGGLSSAMKRAAVQWGIGRYLYNLSATWAVLNATNGKHNDAIRDKDKKIIGWIKWDDPKLPKWALPAESKPETDEDKAKMFWTTLDKEYQDHLKNLSSSEKTELFVKAKFDKKTISDMCDAEIAEARR
jgi:hypothetical protein